MRLFATTVFIVLLQSCQNGGGWAVEARVRGQSSISTGSQRSSRRQAQALPTGAPQVEAPLLKEGTMGKIAKLDKGYLSDCFQKDQEIVFDEVAKDVYFEGNIIQPQVGERNFWTANPMLSLESKTEVGKSSGSCTVITEGDENGDVTYLCTLYYHFTDGVAAGSTLTSEGFYKGGEAEYTITGGTGCFAGASGLIVQAVVDSKTSRASIGLE